jgi:hypothetical protein
MKQNTAYLAALLKANADGRYRLSSTRLLAISRELTARQIPVYVLIIYKEKRWYERHRAGGLQARDKSRL